VQVKRESVESVIEQPATGVTIVTNRDDNVIAFDAQGKLRNDFPFYIAICDGRANPEEFGRVIEIISIGRARVKKTSDQTGEIGCDAS
jgi:Tfp pilus assembly protein FimT